jgi:uncharacterized OsmC-like protein
MNAGDPPIVFRAAGATFGDETLARSDGVIRLRTRTRALTGMQKEAAVEYGPTGNLWRMLCDEGPWLNGSDLAPFPLAFFTAGLTAQLMSDYLAEARERDVEIDALEFSVDNFFTMEGSALKGTMAAGVDPIRIIISASGDTSTEELEDIAVIALEDRSPAGVGLHDELLSRFSIRLNGRPLNWSGEDAPSMDALRDPGHGLSALKMAGVEGDAIIHKDEDAAPPPDEPAVGLQSEQKRQVHVHTDGKLRPDGQKELGVQCIRPAGSRFVFLSDDAADAGGQERAPNGLVYLSAGLAFCFMTQLGRFAEITKQELTGYRLVQDTAFRPGSPYEPAAFPVDTFVCLDSGNPPEDNLQLVHMGEQTCYLHAAFRNAVTVDLAVKNA